MAFKWNDSLVAEMKSMREAGWSAAQIAGALVDSEGFMTTRNAVLGKVHRLGLKKLGDESKSPSRFARKVTVRTPKDNFRAVNIARKALGRTPVIAAEVVTEVVDLIPGTVAFDDLLPHQCRFPTGDGPFMFCGADKFEGSYCARHHRLAYRPRMNITEEERDRRRIRGHNSIVHYREVQALNAEIAA